MSCAHWLWLHVLRQQTVLKYLVYVMSVVFCIGFDCSRSPLSFACCLAAVLHLLRVPDAEHYLFNLQLHKIAHKYGGEAVVAFGGVLASAASRMANDEAGKEGIWVSSLDIPGLTPHRRLCLYKIAAGPNFQHAMETGDHRMTTASQLLLQVLHKALKEKVQAAQPEVSFGVSQLSVLGPDVHASAGALCCSKLTPLCIVVAATALAACRGRGHFEHQPLP